MLPFIFLIFSFLISATYFRFTKGFWNLHYSGTLAMSLMLVLTASGHFMYTEGMIRMIPNEIPHRYASVILSGFAEFAFAVCLLIPAWRYQTARILILFFIVVLPINIYAANHHINYQTGANDGNGPEYLWFRIPLQVLFIFWIYLFTLKNFKHEKQNRVSHS